MCRINKRRKWTARLILELQSWTEACFITLTYDPLYLPKDNQLHKSELQNFFKRLRKNTGFFLRYYACGEYGGKRGRPHFHAIIFGLPYQVCDYDDPKNTWSIIKKAWQDKGIIDVARCELDSMQYVAGYVAKKFNKFKDDGRNKEFTLMSRRPALGSAQLDFFQKHLHCQGPDVPMVFNFQGKNFPIDRTLREKMRKACFTAEYQGLLKEKRREEMQEELLELVSEALPVDDLYHKPYPLPYFEEVLKSDEPLDFRTIDVMRDMIYKSNNAKYGQEMRAKIHKFVKYKERKDL